MKHFSKTLLTLTLCSCVLSLSCSKENPVEQTLDVAVAGSLLNSNLQSTILRCELLFDGSVIGSANFSQATAAATLSGGLTSVKKGSHSIAFKIASQSSSPNTYETVGANVVAGNNTYRLTDQRKSLATGESISYTIDLQ
jgi:hypothetical protein